MRIHKTATELRNCSVDFTDKSDGNALTLVSVTAKNARSGADSTSTIIVPGSAVAGQKVLFSVQAGALGERHQILIQVTTAAAEALEAQPLLLIVAATFMELQAAVAQRIQDGAGKLDQAGIDGCIWEALAGRYGQERPLVRIKDFAGDGATYEYTLDDAVFPGWVEGSSYIRRIEYPAGEKEPSILDGDDYRIVQLSSSVKKLRLLQAVPAAGKTARVEYAVPHAEDGSTVPQSDFYGVANLASAIACRRLAAIYNQMGDSALGADSVEHRSKADRYRTLAKDLEGEFEKAFGLNAEAKRGPATGWREWPSPGSSGEGPLTHG